ncbi:MAG: hypothetical protein ABIQ39_09960, partial [Ilumatobacteraceae bacterium]
AGAGSATDNTATPGSDDAGTTQGTGQSTGQCTGQGTGAGRGYRPGSATAPTGVDQAAYTKALAACKSLVPTFGGAGGGGRLTNAAYIACMKDNGVVLPAFNRGGNTGSSTPNGTAPIGTTQDSSPTGGVAASSVPPLNRNDPTFIAANNKCKVLLSNTAGTSTTVAGGDASATTQAA